MVLDTFGGGIGLRERPWHIRDDFANVNSTGLSGRSNGYNGYYHRSASPYTAGVSGGEYLKAQFAPSWLREAPISGTPRPLPQTAGSSVRFPGGTPSAMATPCAIESGAFEATVRSSAETGTGALQFHFLSTHDGDGYAVRLDGSGGPRISIGTLTAGSFSPQASWSYTGANSSHTVRVERSVDGRHSVSIDGTTLGTMQSDRYSRPDVIRFASTSGDRDWFVEFLDVR